MVGLISRNLRYLLWREGVDRQDWPAHLSEWLGCSQSQATKLLISGGTLTGEQVEKIAVVVGIDGGDLIHADLLEESGTDILRENLRYLLSTLGHGNKRGLAQALGVHPTTVSRWLGDQEPEHKRLFQMAAYFGLSAGTDLVSDPVFLSPSPIGFGDRKAWLKRKLDEMDAETLTSLFPALEKLLGS